MTELGRGWVLEMEKTVVGFLVLMILVMSEKVRSRGLLYRTAMCLEFIRELYRAGCLLLILRSMDLEPRHTLGSWAREPAVLEWGSGLLSWET